jgi:hypothetical protein
MSLASLTQSIANTDLFTAIRESRLVYPGLLATHLATISAFGGMILMTDLRLLGLVMRDMPAGDFIKQLRAWKRAGFVIMVTCGVLLAGSKLNEYYDNPYFQIKLSLLALTGVHAIIFRRRVYSDTAEIDRGATPPGVAKLAGGLSLVLWLGIMCAGRWIAYYDRPVQAAIPAIKAIAAHAGLLHP